MSAVPIEPQLAAPLFRAYVLGSFRLHWRCFASAAGEGAVYEEVSREQWGKRRQAMRLLMVLLARPGRRASKDFLTELFWPDTEPEGAAVYLIQNVAKLRKVLRLVEGGESLLIDERAGYRLASQEQVWTDADAAEALLQQASAQGAQGVPLVQQAVTLLQRGTLLEEEEGTWVLGRRGRLQDLCKKSQLRLGQLLAQQGRLDEAESVLSRLLEEDLTDEEVLSHLMELYHQQGRTQQALRVYERSCEVAASEELELTEATRNLAAQLATADRRSPPPDALTIALDLLGKPETIDPLRRTIVSGILSLLSGEISLEWWEHLTHPRPSPMKREEFTYFQQLIENGWGLCNAGEWNIAEQVLDSFLPDAIRHAPKQADAALLASQGLILQSILQAHQLKLTSMVPLCQQAVLYARETGHPTVICASLNGLAVAFKYNERLEESFQTYLEALGSCDDLVSSLVRSRIYAGAAAAFARKQRKQEADHYIHLAYEIFPSHPEQDAHFLSADHGWYMNAYYQGLMHLALNQPHEALQAFERYNERSPLSGVPQRNYLEIVNHQGRAAILSRALEIYASCLEHGIAGALELKSKKRLNEVIKTFQQEMPPSWRNHQQIKPFVERYPFLLQEAR